MAMDLPAVKKNRKAIVTLAVGKRYEIMFKRSAEASWRQYCDKFGFDLITITQPLDTSLRAQKRSPAWQKLLILSQEWSQHYENILWLDTDILINADIAEDITKNILPEKVSGVESYSIPTPELHRISIAKRYHAWKKAGVKYLDNMTPGLYYTNRGIPGENLNAVLQAGVFVCSPIKHKEIFEHVYYTYEDTHGAEWNYEQPALSYELVRNNLVHWLPAAFNASVSAYIAAHYPFIFPELSLTLGNDPQDSLKFSALLNIYETNYFMHFAGCADLMISFHARLRATGKANMSSKFE